MQYQLMLQSGDFLSENLQLGEEVQGDYAMQRLIKHDKADVGSPLLEANINP